jgi:SNF2 family DNA or RNA helicase
MTNNRSVLSIGFSDADCAYGTKSPQTDLFGAEECNDLRRIVHPPLIYAFDRIELHPKSVKGSQWTIEIIHCAGDVRVHLARLLDAQLRKEDYCLTDECIVDMKSKFVTGALAQARGIGADGVLSLSSTSLMLLRGGFVSLQFDGDEKLTKKIKKMFSGKPRKEVTVPAAVCCTLRNYQVNGVAWLLFLYDYYLCGLLCDEMGLGKTIQILTLIAIVKEQHNGVTACIVCPTSVVSHWNNLLARFSPSLRVVDYAKERKLPAKAAYDVILLSYGIMRNDIDTLERRNFDILVFDEVQQLKNRDTAGYRTACRLRGRTIIGCTGTPVENSAEDLHSLFNLVLPGLTIDIPSETALLQAVDSQLNTEEITRFKRRIEPFILRRSKAEVLTELPAKIEENRFCELAPYQSELYREALVNRAKPLIETLARSDQPIPYMHIFSLMTFLKQLCNTPALIAGNWKDYTLYESGKWELFKELLDESLGSGGKTVVFTQFLDMVEIFKHYLLSINIDFEALTGSSINRDKIIRRFAEDDDCKVFIGSLKAGGVGIDLIAASVVIHYDRWWNAAREDQATDRVHRFGQTRGVQVFKLITENTLEERIDRIIEQKKILAQMALTEDDPESVKHFTRDELIDLLSM